MYKHLEVIEQYLLKDIMRGAKTHKYFLTDEEFKKDMGRILCITGAIRNTDNEMKRLTKEIDKLNNRG